jgi:hypothetical protein
VVLGAELTHNVSPDAYDNFVVWAAHESAESTQGQVVVHDLATGEELVLGDPSTEISMPRVYGHDYGGALGAWVVWQELLPNTYVPPGAPEIGVQVRAYSTHWETNAPVTIGAGYASSVTVDIGERYVVWEQVSNDQSDIVGYDLLLGRQVAIAVDPTLNERNVTTFGLTIAWEEQDVLGDSRIESLTRSGFTSFDETRASLGLGEEPSLGASLLAYAVPGAGERQLHIAERDTGDVFAASLDLASSKGSHNVHGSDVAYVSDSDGQTEIYLERVLPACTPLDDEDDVPDSAEEAIDDLVSTVPTLSDGSDASLLNQLAHAQSKIADAEADLATGETTKARNGFCQARRKLSTFIALVESKIEDGGIAPATGEALIQEANVAQALIDQRLAEAGLSPCPE